MLFRAGAAGLALMRLSPDGRAEEILTALKVLRGAVRASDRWLASGDDLPVPLPEVGVQTGYREWAASYDQPGNPLIALEEQVMRPLLTKLRPGRALDVAAGTGRNARMLAALGHRVLAVDASTYMLAGLSGVPAVAGDMTGLPLVDDSFDLVVCSLALTHASSLNAPLREMARVVRPGGLVVLSDIHPLIAACGGQAFYRTAQGETRFVRNRVWWPSAYLAEFADAGLSVLDCSEPLLGAATGIPHFMDQPSDLEDSAGRLAFDSLPGAIIWKLCRRDGGGGRGPVGIDPAERGEG